MSGADVPDPTTGLTGREKDMIRGTWAAIKTDQKGYAFDLFITFFTENPSYQVNFTAFKDVPIQELRGNKKVLAHALSVLYAISSLVDNLDDPECLVEMLHKLGTSHFKRHISYPHFENLGVSLLGSMKQKLGSDVMNEAAMAAWQKAYGVIISVIKQGLESAEADGGK